MSTPLSSFATCDADVCGEVCDATADVTTRVGACSDARRPHSTHLRSALRNSDAFAISSLMRNGHVHVNDDDDDDDDEASLPGDGVMAASSSLLRLVAATSLDEDDVDLDMVDAMNRGGKNGEKDKPNDEHDTDVWSVCWCEVVNRAQQRGVCLCGVNV